jgi:hypothetical protein
MSEAELCNHCGAPRVAGYAACKYCKTPFPTAARAAEGGGEAGRAIPCPRCNTLNEPGAQKCVQCQTWIVVQCVFCHAISPHNVPACVKCGEAFAGAPQRFAERQRQQQLQQGINIAGQVGNVAASMLGAAAMAGVFSGRSHHEHYEHHHYSHHHGGYEPPPPPPPDVDYGPTGAGIAQSSESSGGGFFDSLFGGSSDSSGGTGAGISQSGSDDSSSGGGGGFFDSVFSGDSSSSDDSGGGDDGGSFFDDD